MKKPNDFMAKLDRAAKKANSAVTLVSFKNCKTYDGTSFWILCAQKDADKFQIVETLVNSLSEDEGAKE